MELLIFAGMVMKGITWLGYGIAGSFVVGTGIRYVKDYKEAVENERG